MNTDIEIDRDEPDYRNDGSAELNQRDRIGLLFSEPAIRNYVFAAAISLLMIVMLLGNQGSDIGALLIVITGACGILLQFPAAPIFVLVILVWFMCMPTGLGMGYSFNSLIEERRFHFLDVIMVLSVLVYLASQYRIYGLVYQAMAFESRTKLEEEPHTRRPASLVRPTELSAMLGFSVGLVILGQLIWWLATSLEVAPADEFPLNWAESRSSLIKKNAAKSQTPGATKDFNPSASEFDRFDDSGVVPRGMSRFFVMLGMLFFGTLISTLVFRYWRLKTIGPAEGAMILLETGWKETSRERVRLEKWRIWGRKRAEARARESNRSGSTP